MLADIHELSALALIIRQSDEQESDAKVFIREIPQYVTIEELREIVLNRLISRIVVGEAQKTDR